MLRRYCGFNVQRVYQFTLHKYFYQFLKATGLEALTVFGGARIYASPNTSSAAQALA